MGFTTTVLKEIDFDGHTIRVVHRRLKRKEAIKLAPHLPQSEEEAKDGLLENLVLLDKVAEVMPDVVVSISGYDVDGRDITIQDVCEEAFFTPVLGQLFQSVWSNSFVKADEAKNSNAPQAEASGG